MFNLKKKILNKSQLKKLGEHKYNCMSNSLLDSYLQPYWNFLVARLVSNTFFSLNENCLSAEMI
jgi:hypothetical protein